MRHSSGEGGLELRPAGKPPQTNGVQTDKKCLGAAPRPARPAGRRAAIAHRSACASVKFGSQMAARAGSRAPRRPPVAPGVQFDRNAAPDPRAPATAAPAAPGGRGDRHRTRADRPARPPRQKGVNLDAALSK